MATEINNTVTGHDAINIAENLEFVLQKYADPTEVARIVTVDEAREIAATDPSLIYLDLTGTNIDTESFYMVDGHGNRSKQHFADIHAALSAAERNGYDLFARIEGGENVCVWTNPDVEVS